MAKRGNEPTPTQQRVLDFIRRFLADNDRSPTEREVAAHFGWKSKFAARQNIHALIRKGLLDRTPGVARGISIAGKAARRSAGLRGVPLVGTVPAGRPIDAIEDVEGMIGIDPSMFPDVGVFALRVRGDSMIGVGINDGDIALVRQSDMAGDGDLVVAVIDGEATLKRFLRRDGDWVLHPENPAYRDIVIPRDADLRLCGVVVGIVRKIA